MPLLELFRTATFRLAFTYVCLFAASVILLLGFIYWRTSAFIQRQADETIAAEIVGLAEQYRRRGVEGLRQVIVERSARAGISLYLLAGEDGTPIAGNVRAWPAGIASGPVNFSIERPTENGTESRPGHAILLTLPNGYRLLVGRDMKQVSEVEATIRNTLLYALGLTALFGVIGGAYISRNVMRRLELINRTSQEIMSGDLTRRIPVRGDRDELDHLAVNLNAMLDQIETLMTGMREVADNIAHDLRTPLNRLRNKLEGLTIGDGGTREDTIAALEGAIGEADNLIATFNSLLLIAEAETGAHRDTMEPVDLRDIVRDITDLYEPVAEQRGIKLEVSAPTSVPVRGNRSLLARAAANLVENALKFTPEGGQVRVTTASPRDEPPYLSVSDTGPGIPEEDRERVLDRFVRLERSRNTPGSGLGLSLVAAVARMHDGKVELGDNRPGLSAKFIFPRVLEATAAATSVNQQARHALPGPVAAQ
ncbi:MAG: HAMP domain-containing protein [Alphaproteobacteria bacterium]|nr:HAMP domain-containing protein [Alphaproteobacteria bacterium]